MRSEAAEEARDPGRGDDREHAAARALGEPALAVLDLLVHVGHVEVGDLAAGGGGRHRLGGLVGVHVNLQRARIADDEHAVAERVEAAVIRAASSARPLTAKFVQ